VERMAEGGGQMATRPICAIAIRHLL